MRERILVVTSQFPFGRGEAFLAAEFRALAAQGTDITIVAIHPQTRRPQTEMGLLTIALRWSAGAVLRDAFQTLITQPVEVYRVAVAMCRARYRLTAKLKNLVVFGQGLALAGYARREKITLIHAHWLTTPSTVAFVAAQLTRLPWSVSAHRFDLFADNWIVPKLSSAAAVRVISERGARHLRELAPPAVRGRVQVLHLGVDMPPQVARLAMSMGPLRIAAIGLLVEVKGHRDLIDAMAQLRDSGVLAVCRIAGDGPLRKLLQSQIDRLGLHGIVELRGFVDHERIVSELAAGDYDIVAHPSIEEGSLHEGIPVAVMEAMAFGIPCVTTRTGSIPELVNDACGIVVEQRDPGALARAFSRLACDPVLRNRLGSAARQRVKSEFDAYKTSASLLDLIQRTSCDARVSAT